MKSAGLKFFFAALLLTLFHFPQIAAAEDNSERWKPQVKCHLTFDLKSWSVFYKSGKGEGAITCSNGQRASVKIRTHGGGVTFGKNEIKNGKGVFSKIDDISQLYGSYGASEAHAGVSGSAGAQAMTKGSISLAISGTGKGYDLGFAFGSFKITPK